MNSEPRLQPEACAALTGVVHIVDDDEAFRAALIRLIRSAGLEARGHGCASHLHEALDGDQPRCIILDMRLDGETGLAVQETLRVRGQTAPVIFLTGFGTISETVHAMRAGAAEFLTKPVSDDVLLTAVYAALEHDGALAEGRRSQADLEARWSTLTDREREIMALAIGGLMNKQIAWNLGITEITAKVHKRRVMEKMQARSLPDLVRMAERLGVHAIRSR